MVVAHLLALLVGLSGTAWCAPTWSGQASHDERFLEGLRERRLFELAESHCRQRLADRQISESERVQLTVELVRVFAEHAVNAPLARRADLWRQAQRTALEFLSAHRQHPRRILVQVQLALTYLAEGELARREAEVAADPGPLLKAAIETLRRAVTMLEESDEQLAEEVVRARRSDDQDTERLSAAHLQALQHDVRYQLARALRSRALCYAPQSADRVAALTEALDQLQKPLLELPPDSPWIWRFRLDQAVCQRLLGAWQAAARLLGELQTQRLPAAARLLVRAERARLELARNRPQQALEILRRGREIDGAVSAELDFAHLETYVALWQAAGDADDEAAARRWEERSVVAVEFIEQTHGPYWARRAELLLIGTGRRRGSGSVEILARTADDLLLKGRPGEALDAYDRAAAAAAQAGQESQAFRLTYKAALVRQQQQQYAEASRRFRRLAQSSKSHPQSARAHLAAVVNAAEAARLDPAAGPLYVELLEEHLREWPGAATADTVAQWLGQQREREQEWGLALAAYREVSTDAPQYAAAVEAAGRCWLRWLHERKAAGQPLEELATQAIAYCDEVVGAAETEWNPARRAAALAGARVRLLYAVEEAPVARRQLAQALQASEQAADSWQRSARVMLIAATTLGAEPQPRDFGALDALDAATAEDLRELIAVVSNSLSSASAEQRRSRAGLLLETVARLGDRVAELDASGRPETALARAEALAAVGRREEAVAAYAALVERYPDQQAIQTAYADYLTQSDDRRHLQTALDRWRLVASRSRPRSTLWFEAKYGVALVQFKLNDRRGAARLIRYLQATEDLAAAGFEERFDRLLKRCQSDG